MPEGLNQMENPTRTRDLPACSAVPQPSAPPRTPGSKVPRGVNLGHPPPPLYLLSRLRLTGVIPQYTHTLSRYAQGQLYIYLYLYFIYHVSNRSMSYKLKNNITRKMFLQYHAYPQYSFKCVMWNGQHIMWTLPHQTLLHTHLATVQLVNIPRLSRNMTIAYRIHNILPRIPTSSQLNQVHPSSLFISVSF